MRLVGTLNKARREAGAAHTMANLALWETELLLNNYDLDEDTKAALRSIKVKIRNARNAGASAFNILEELL